MITLIVVVVVVGVLLLLFNTLVKLPEPYKTVVNALVGLLVFLYAVDVLAGTHFLSRLR